MVCFFSFAKTASGKVIFSIPLNMKSVGLAITPKECASKILSLFAASNPPISSLGLLSAKPSCCAKVKAVLNLVKDYNFRMALVKTKTLFERNIEHPKVIKWFTIENHSWNLY